MLWSAELFFVFRFFRSAVISRFEKPSHATVLSPTSPPKPQFASWLIEQVETGQYLGLRYVGQNRFRVPWKHNSRKDCNDEDSRIFRVGPTSSLCCVTSSESQGTSARTWVEDGEVGLPTDSCIISAVVPPTEVVKVDDWNTR